jgi:hypothetical protein
MRRMVLLITVACCGLSLVFSNHPQMVMAQTQRSDTIYFLGATRGNNYNGTGVLSWCVSQSWHSGYKLPDGTQETWLSALDEVAQVAPPPPGNPGSWTDTQFYNSCHSDPLGPSGGVDLTTYGVTNQSNCGTPCNSLIVVGRSFSYSDSCQFIEANLWDAGAWDATHQEGHWRGTQIMIHAQAPNATGANYPLPPIQVTTTGFYASNEIGTIKDDSPCLGGLGWRGYHVHHAFKPPVTQSCASARNTSTSGGLVYQATDRQKGNTAHWVHVLNHPFGVFCDDVGPKAADNLLEPATGALNGDGNGAGTKGLAQGPPGYKITTPQTCFPGTSWCGTMDITQPVLQGARCYNRGMLPIHCFNSWQRRFPPPGGGVTEWYSDATYYYQVTYSHAWPYGGDNFDRCGVPVPLGSPIYRIRLYSSQSIGNTCNNPALFIDFTQEFANNSYTATEVQAIFERFRGAGGVNPSVPPSPQDANTWAVTQIDSGHWWDVVQPALDGVIRGARDQRDTATLGITGNPAFDGNPGPTTYSSSVFDRMNTVAFRTTGPRLISRPPKEINSDWIRSTRLTWGPARKTFEMVLN